MIWCVVLNPAVDVTYEVRSVTPLPEIQYARRADYQAGGKGHNVARAIHALGGSASVAGLYGGLTGRWIRRELRRRGIAVLAESIDEPSRLCITVADGHGHQAEIRERGPRVEASSVLTLLDRLAERVTPRDWVVLSGGLPPGLEPDVARRVVERFRSEVRGVLVDTSGEALRCAWDAAPLVMTPNREEARALLAELPPSPGPEYLAVTLGRDGVAWRRRGEPAWAKPAPSVDVKTTTGAGDAFLAGLATALDREWDFPEAMDWGMAVAAASVQELGVAVFDRDEVERLHAAVTAASWQPTALDPGGL